MKGLYFYIHIFTLAYPIAQSFEHRIQYAKKWKYLFPAISLTATFFIIWDILFTQNGVWGFNPTYTSGIKLLYLPIEEWLFFVSVPFASVFIYECVKYFLPKTKTGKYLRSGFLLAGICLVILGFIHYEKSYTFWNFLFCGALMIGVSWKNPTWLGFFTLAYLLHLIPFFLVNGLLTGSFIEEPVVWYNNEENLGIRLFTIPVEDTIYALLLLLMNLSWYELFKNYSQSKT